MRSKYYFCKLGLNGLLATVLTFMSSNSLAQGEKKEDSKASAKVSAKANISDHDRKVLRRLFKSYVPLQEAFHNDDSEEVIKRTQKVIDILNQLKSSQIKAQASQSLSKLDGISGQSSRKKMNKALHSLSLTMIYWNEIHQIDSDFGAFACPMAKMQWLQAKSQGDQVLNPYDTSMPHCGGKREDIL